MATTLRARVVARDDDDTVAGAGANGRPRRRAAAASKAAATPPAGDPAAASVSSAGATTTTSSSSSYSDDDSDAHLLVSKRRAALDATKTAPASRRRRRAGAARSAPGGGGKSAAPALPRAWWAPWRRPAPPLLGRGLEHLDSYADLPDYLRDNEFILTSYRRGEQGVWPSVRSLFGLHNETGNVWTHLVGTAMFALLALWFAAHPPAPLAITASHVEHMARAHWSRAHGDGSAGGDGALLGGGGGGGSLARGLSAGVHALEHSVAAGVHALEHSVSAGVHAIEETVAAALLAAPPATAGGAAGADGSPAPPPPEAALAAARALVARARAAASASLHPGAFVYPAPRWPVYVYFAGAMVCLGTSTVCHLLGCCTQHVVELVWRFDYVGIAALIVASFVPTVCYAFLCEPGLRLFYLGTTAAMGVGVVAVSLPNRFQAPEYRPLRAAVFSALGMWGVVPVGHQLLLHRGAWAVRTAFGLDALMGAVYLGGAAIYACRIPERWYPGRFDIVGHSHQLWHTAVVLAAYVHYRAVLVLLEWRDASGGCAAADLLGAGPPARLRADFAALGTPAVGSADEVWSGLSASLAARYAAAHGGPGGAGPLGV